MLYVMTRNGGDGAARLASPQLESSAPSKTKPASATKGPLHRHCKPCPDSGRKNGMTNRRICLAACRANLLAAPGDSDRAIASNIVIAAPAYLECGADPACGTHFECERDAVLPQKALCMLRTRLGTTKAVSLLHFATALQIR